MVLVGPAPLEPNHEKIYAGYAGSNFLSKRRVKSSLDEHFAMKKASRCTLLAAYMAAALLTGCGGSSDSLPPTLTWTAGSSNSPVVVGPGTGPGTGEPVPFVPPTEPLGGSYLYVTETEGDALGVYNPDTYQLVARVPVGDVPRGLTFDSSRERVLVSR